MMGGAPEGCLDSSEKALHAACHRGAALPTCTATLNWMQILRQ